jgi:uncharacterized protein (DUF2336 family)
MACLLRSLIICFVIFDRGFAKAAPTFLKPQRHQVETATLQLLAELDATEGWPAERWATILDRTARLFLGNVENLSAPQIDLFDGVFVRLMDRVDTASLVRLSQTLCELKYTLPQVSRRLVFDDNESVFAPVLKSRGTALELLIEVIRTRGLKHHLAIASRRSIDPSLSEALIKYGLSDVHHALAENRGAQMSEAGWARLAELGKSDAGLVEKLARRRDMPGPIKREIQAKLEDAHMRAQSTRPLAMREQIEDTVASGKASGLPNPEPSDLARAQARMTEVARQGKLRDSTVNRAAAARDYVEVAAALAVLTGSPMDVIWALIAGEKIEGLVLACRAGRLTWGTTKMVVKNRSGLPPVPADELEKARKIFESFSLSTAQRTVRF